MSPKKFSRVFSNDSLSPNQIILTNLFEEITPGFYFSSSYVGPFSAASIGDLVAVSMDD